MTAKRILPAMIILLIIDNGLTQILNIYNTDNSPLPSNTIRTVCIEPEGIKWFGTDEGLVRYDGSEWLVFTKTDETHTLADNMINDIAFEHGSDGPEIWVGTENGLTVLDVNGMDGYTFATPYRMDNRPLLSNKIQAVEVDSQHVKWIATDRGVSVFNGENWNELTRENGFLKENDVTCIGIDNECDSLWRYFGTRSKGISRIYIDNVDGITAASAYVKQWTGMLSDSIKDIYVVNESKHWIAFAGGVAEHDTTLTKERWTVHTSAEGMVDDRTLTIEQDQDGSMWFGTEGGLSGWNGAVYTNLTTAEGLSGNKVYDIAVDLDGSLWLGTDNGITHLNPPAGAVNRLSFNKGAALYQLYQNYPNPFNSSTDINYDINTDTHISLIIYNLRGQVVRVLVDAEQSAGSYLARWDAGHMPSGIYIARLQSGGDTKRVKCIRIALMK